MMTKINCFQRFVAYFIVVFICGQLKICCSYVIVETDKSGQNLFNSLFEHEQQFGSKALNTESSSKERLSAGKASDEAHETPIANKIQLQYAEKTGLKKVSQTQKSCLTCGSHQLSTHVIEEHYTQRLEYIKQQILSKLGMSSAPKLDYSQIDASTCKY